MLHIIKPGFFSTVQDRGRIGFQQYGVIVSGVMDQVAYRIGNALLKQENEAAIEMTLIGGTFEFTKPTSIILTGGPMQATLNKELIPMYKVIPIDAGDVLECGAIVHGTRSYLCIAGGFQVEALLTSRSTYIKAGFGGFNGRPLRAKDCIPYNESRTSYTAKRINPQAFYKGRPIRVLAGTEWHRFSEQTQKIFLQQEYTVSLEADRMGYRLQNDTPITLAEPFQLISEAVTFGTVQIPPSGEPIILMADRQTTGGYPKIAQVISADLHRLAQKGPKQHIQFKLVSIAQAEEAYIALETNLRLVESLAKSH